MAAAQVYLVVLLGTEGTATECFPKPPNNSIHKCLYHYSLVILPLCRSFISPTRPFYSLLRKSHPSSLVLRLLAISIIVLALIFPVAHSIDLVDVVAVDVLLPSLLLLPYIPLHCSSRNPWSRLSLSPCNAYAYLVRFGTPRVRYPGMSHVPSRCLTFYSLHIDTLLHAYDTT